MHKLFRVEVKFENETCKIDRVGYLDNRGVRRLVAAIKSDSFERIDCISGPYWIWEPDNDDGWLRSIIIRSTKVKCSKYRALSIKDWIILNGNEESPFAREIIAKYFREVWLMLLI